MDRAAFVYTTFPSLVEAEAAARVSDDRDDFGWSLDQTKPGQPG